MEQFNSTLNTTLLANKPKEIKLIIEYQFTRAQPPSATVVSTKQDYILYNQTYNVDLAIKEFIEALNSSSYNKTQCQNLDVETVFTNIEMGKDNVIDPVIYLDSTQNVQFLFNKIWSKQFYMHYDYCLNVWVLKQNFTSFDLNDCSKFPEVCVFKQ